MATAKIQTVKGVRVEIFSYLAQKNTTRPKEAIAYAIKISKEQYMKCVVAQWFADLDRH